VRPWQGVRSKTKKKWVSTGKDHKSGIFQRYGTINYFYQRNTVCIV
jgi:hypothetical protein